VRISRDLSIRFIFSLVRITHAEDILSTYACDAGANNNSWAVGESLSKTACIFSQKSNGETLEKLDPAWDFKVVVQ